MLNKLASTVRNLYPSPQEVILQTGADYLHFFGTEKQALLYALVFLPSFEEVLGSVLQVSFRLNASSFPLSFINAINEGGALHDIEDSFNYVETSYIFNLGNMENLTDEDDKLFAECVAEAWRGRLALLYPSRKFNVHVVEPPESGDAYGVSFHEIRKQTIR